MPRFKLLSKRRRHPQENPDVYQYDVLSGPFRGQVMHILIATLGRYQDTRRSSYLSAPSANHRWETLFLRYIRELGAFQLGDSPHANPFQQCSLYLQNAATSEALDFIDYAFHFIDQDLRREPEYVIAVSSGYQYRLLDEAIEELNERFQEHQIGYQFQDGQLMKRTDQYIHEEVVLPALTLLSEPQFRGAQDEFLSAHRHYRELRYKEAVADALKAFESTMKSILDERQWQYEKERDAARRLIQILFDHELIPAMLQSQFTQLRGLLEGLLTIRNKTSGHGQGTEPMTLPKYVAEYALHMAAANIVFLVQAYEAYKQGSGAPIRDGG